MGLVKQFLCFSKESETGFLVTGNNIVTYQVFQEYQNLFFVANGTESKQVCDLLSWKEYALTRVFAFVFLSSRNTR
jgi:hypothetical protein